MKKLLFFLFLIGCTQTKNESESFNKEKINSEFTERANERMFEDIYEELAQDYPNQTPQWLHIAAISKFYSLKSNGN